MKVPIKKQHYVSRFYLKSWLSEKSTNDKKAIKVYNKKKNKEYNCTDLNSISQERFFYELNVTQNVFDLILARYYTKALKNTFLKEFIEIANVLLKLNEYQNNLEKKHENTNVINQNILEKEYSKLENMISPIINKINNDLEKYLDELNYNPTKSLALIELFLIQFYRTKKMREKLNTIMKKLFVEKNNIKKELTDEEKKAFFKVIQYLDPITESHKVIENNFSIELIKNNTKTNFITSNSPAVMEKTDEDELMGFMPITPFVFLLIRFQNIESKKFKYREVNDINIIEALNSMIYKNSDEIYTTQLYNKSEETNRLPIGF
jgi:hypothetical protein